MPGWMRVIRGMIGTGLAFAAGVGVAGTLIGLAWLIPGAVTARELFGLVGRCAVIAFPVGAAFSGVLAVTSRGRSFERLSLPRFAALGAGGGMLVFGLLSLNAWSRWSTADAVANAAILTMMGAGAASAILLLARRAKPALGAGEDVRSLGEGEAREVRRETQRSRDGVRR